MSAMTKTIFRALPAIAAAALLAAPVEAQNRIYVRPEPGTAVVAAGPIAWTSRGMPPHASARGPRGSPARTRATRRSIIR